MAKAKVAKKKAQFTVSLASAAGFVPLAKTAYDGYQFGGITTAMNEVTLAMTGYDPQRRVWRAANLMKGAVPIGLGLLVHKIASKLGVNRALGRAKIPFLRV